VADGTLDIGGETVAAYREHDGEVIVDGEDAGRVAQTQEGEWYVVPGGPYEALDERTCLLRFDSKADAVRALTANVVRARLGHIRRYRDLEAGEVFHSPRPEEGRVRVVCPPGACRHDVRDEYNCHIVALDPPIVGNEFFVQYDPRGWVEMSL
jgi:hypothetical protein